MFIYFAFAGSNFYPARPSGDFLGKYGTEQAALKAAKKEIDSLNLDWCEIWQFNLRSQELTIKHHEGSHEN